MNESQLEDTPEQREEKKRLRDEQMAEAYARIKGVPVEQVTRTVLEDGTVRWGVAKADKEQS